MKKSIKILCSCLLCMALLPACVIGNIKTADAAQVPKAFVWKDTIAGDINTDGSITVREQKIIDITKFIEHAKKHIPGETTTTSQSSKDDDNNSKLDPIIWGFQHCPENAAVSVSDLKVAICGDGDLAVGQWESIPGTTFMSKWKTNSSPTKNCHAYDADEKQIFCYLDLLNSQSYTESEAYNKIAGMTARPDTNTWNFNKALINITYTINGAGVIYKDVADFNWAYVSNTWASDTYDVNLSVTLPVGSTTIDNPFKNVDVADGEDNTESQNNTAALKERNIYAWGHGSANGIVSLDDSGLVKVSNDKVPAGTDAEVRIVFPSSWLDNVKTNTGESTIGSADVSHANQTKLSTILKEESVWQDGRTQEVRSYMLPMIFIPICIIIVVIALITSIITKRKYGRRVIKREEYERMHPCVQVRLKNWNREHAHDMVASLLHLNEIGFVKIRKLHSGDFEIRAKDPAALAEILEIPVADVKEKTVLPKKETTSTSDIPDTATAKKADSSALAKLGIIESLSKLGVERIDILTLQFLFGRCGFHRPKIQLQDILNFGNARSRDYWAGYSAWHADLTKDVARVCDFAYINTHIRHVFYVVAVILWVVSALIGMFTANLFMFLAGMIAGCILALIANTMRNKLWFEDENGNKVESSQIPMKFGNYNDEIDQFKSGFKNLLGQLEKSVQEKLHYLP